MGHLPFSHAAEEELLPDGANHELITWEIVHSPAMVDLFESLTPPVRPDDVGKVAIGPDKVERLGLDGVGFKRWEAVFAEVIVGDSFGADRMDSPHAPLPFRSSSVALAKAPSASACNRITTRRRSVGGIVSRIESRGSSRSQPTSSNSRKVVGVLQRRPPGLFGLPSG